MEKKLCQLFVEKRIDKGEIVRRAWFRRKATAVFKECYGSETGNIFVFSSGWCNGFLRRWGISGRALTKIASKVPTEYRCLIINWLRFNRRVSQPHNDIQRLDLYAGTGCFHHANILNLDETPLPFEFLEGRTYDFRGSKTISAKADRSGGDKHRATLILYIFAEGVGRIKPKLIFHGETGDNIRRKEQNHWSNEVTVEFNPTAYNNKSLFTKFIHEELIPALHGNQSLLLLDAVAFHITNSVLSLLRNNLITPSLIPGGCTGLIQPLDTHVNKPFKQLLKDEADLYIANQEATLRQDFEKWNVSDKQIMCTVIVGRAWEKFCQTRQEMVQKAFRDVVVTLSIDGSQDHELAIKGFDSKDLTAELANGKWTESLSTAENYTALPSETSDHEDIEFSWVCENYYRYLESMETDSAEMQKQGPPGKPGYGGYSGERLTF